MNDRQSSETRTVDNGPKTTLCSFDDKMMSSNRRN